MKSKVKLLSIFLVSITLFLTGILPVFAQEPSSSITVNNNGISISKTHLDNLLSLGFTNEQILNMEKEEFELNKELKGNVVSTNYGYYIGEASSKDKEVNKAISTSPLDPEDDLDYQINERKVSKEEYYKSLAKYENPSINEYDSVEDKKYHKMMTTQIIGLAGNKYRVHNTVTWSKFPFTRKKDVIGVGINLAHWAPERGTEYGKQGWIKKSSCNGSVQESAIYNSSSDKWKRDSGGYALTIDLPNEKVGGCDAEITTQLSSYMYYSVSNIGTSSRLDAYGQYVHQTAVLAVTPSVSISGASISVSPAGKFEVAGNTHATKY